MSAMLAASIALSVGLAAVAAPADVAATRQTRFKELGAAFKTVNDELRRSSPDMAKVRAAMGIVNRAAAELPAWFPAGSGPQNGVITKSRAEIWTRKAEFTAHAREFSGETRKLQALLAAGDLDAMKPQAKVVAGTCGACHTDFRAKDAS